MNPSEVDCYAFSLIQMASLLSVMASRSFRRDQLRSCGSRLPQFNLLSYLPAILPRLSRGLQEEEVNEALEASLDEQYLTHSSRHDSHQLPRSSSFLLDMQEASSAVEVTSEYFHYKENKGTQAWRIKLQ